MSETAATVTLPSRVEADAHAANYRLRTHLRQDGRVAYELVDELTGRVKARSRNFHKVHAHLRRRLRGTKAA